MGKLYRAICGKYRKLEKPKILLSLRENLDYFFFFCSKSRNEDEKIFKVEDSIEIIKLLGLIENI